MSADQSTPCFSWKRSRWGFASFFFLSLFVAFSVLRLLLFLKFRPGGPLAAADVVRMFLIGARSDLFVALLMTLPLLFWLLIIADRWFRARWHRVLFWLGFILFWVVEVFLLAAEYYFFEEFTSRFNTVAVDYLFYPYEVFVNIWASYPVPAVVALCVACSLIWFFLAKKLFTPMWEQPGPLRARLVSLAIVIGVCALLRPAIQLKGPHFSQDRVMNELANNGAISFVAAAWTHHLDFAAFYKTIPKDEAYQRVRKMLTEPGVEFAGDGENLRRKVAGDSSKPKLNVVIFLEESLGSEFWGSLGRKKPTLTPEMDKLAAEEGMLFTNMYATGNRTVRGFEGVLSSFPPLPGDSIVKRDLSDNVETIARVLKRDGYSTVFLYGGRGLFDGMRSFAVHNGYNRFIEQKDFPKPTFTTVWGVCDEDLFGRAIEEFRELSKSGKPFCATLLSVSNHKPYTFPEGRIPEKPDRHRGGAVKYSDYCLGKFFREAKKEPFWTNTIFVVVADHGARVYGKQSIPIHSYEIPLLIAGPAVVKNPSRIPQLGSQLDVSPTILGLLGRPYETLFFGHDLLRSPLENERAFLNHNRDIGMLAHDRLVILGLMQGEEFYEGAPKKGDMKPLAQPSEADRDLQKDAIAVYQVADDLYVHKKYHLDP